MYVSDRMALLIPWSLGLIISLLLNTIFIKYTIRLVLDKAQDEEIIVRVLIIAIVTVIILFSLHKVLYYL